MIIKTRTADKQPENYEGAGIEACASELIRAVHAKDTSAVAQALQDAFEILDAQPHEEGPHVQPHSYDAQK